MCNPPETATTGSLSSINSYCEKWGDYIANRLYLTEVHAEVDGDIYFPEFDKSQWQETSRENYSACDKNPYDYSFIVYER